MNHTLRNFFIFAVGAAIGSAVTWYIVKTKYEQIANEEIESVKEAFRCKDSEPEVEEPIEPEDEHTADPKPEEVASYRKMLNTLHYTNEPEVTENDEEKGAEGMTEKKSGPYVITPDEFGNIEEYDAISLNYYADGVLADDWDEVIEDVDDVVGEDSLNRFGEYEEDSVFVRNDDRCADYEILRDLRNYWDVVGKNEDQDND